MIPRLSKEERAKNKARIERNRKRNQRRHDYAKYMRSPEWKLIRAKALKHYGNKCRDCNRCPEFHDDLVLHVHHKTYERMGRERMSDLEVLCKECHDVRHEERHPVSDELTEEFRRIVS